MDGEALDAKLLLEEFQDYLAPKLDTYEQAIYLYLVRHTRLQGKSQITVGFKSARRRMALGLGIKGSPMAEGTCYEKLASLKAKGCVQILGTERDGTRIRVRLPVEIEGLIPPEQQIPALSLEEMDFFGIVTNRLAILKRENSRCFYCMFELDEFNYVIEHVVSRPSGGNGYSNVVAACRNCNNRKGSTDAQNYLRTLYRDGYLSSQEFEGRQSALRQLIAGELRPVVEQL